MEVCYLFFYKINKISYSWVSRDLSPRVLKLVSQEEEPELEDESELEDDGREKAESSKVIKPKTTNTRILELWFLGFWRFRDDMFCDGA